VPSFHHSLLSGFSPVGVELTLDPKEKSLYPTVAGEDGAANRELLGERRTDRMRPIRAGRGTRVKQVTG
jgi:hypothetical protein